MGAGSPVQPFDWVKLPQFGAFWHFWPRRDFPTICTGGVRVTYDYPPAARNKIDEAKRLIERSRILCATAADLTREAKAIQISISKSLVRKRKVLRPQC
jgi:hypothetical protein